MHSKPTRCQRRQSVFGQGTCRDDIHDQCRGDAIQRPMPIWLLEFGSSNNLVDVSAYTPLSNYKVWMSNSQDSTWMANFFDFASNSSHNENCSWFNLDGEDDCLSVGESLDLECYEESTHLNVDQKLAIEEICRRYVDDKWGQSMTELFGDQEARLGPT